MSKRMSVSPNALMAAAFITAAAYLLTRFYDRRRRQETFEAVTMSPTDLDLRRIRLSYRSHAVSPTPTPAPTFLPGVGINSGPGEIGGPGDIDDSLGDYADSVWATHVDRSPVQGFYT